MFGPFLKISAYLSHLHLGNPKEKYMAAPLLPSQVIFRSQVC